MPDSSHTSGNSGASSLLSDSLSTYSSRKSRNFVGNVIQFDPCRRCVAKRTMGPAREYVTLGSGPSDPRVRPAYLNSRDNSRHENLAMRRRKSRSPKGTRAAKSPKRQPWTPRSPSPAPRQRERTGESLRKKLVRWGEELESLVTVFPSRREVHEVVKHVSYVMMAMAATVLLPKIVEHIRVFQDSYFCRGGFLLPVVLANMIWLCASE